MNMVSIDVELGAFERLFNIRSFDEDSLFGGGWRFQVDLWMAGFAPPSVTLPIQQEKTYHRARSK